MSDSSRFSKDLARLLGERHGCSVSQVLSDTFGVSKGTVHGLMFISALVLLAQRERRAE